MFSISVRPRTLLTVLLGAVALVVGVSYALTFAVTAGGVQAHPVVWLAWLLGMDNERNVPAWSSTVLLAAIALSCLEVARRLFAERGRWRWHWLALSAGFAYLSLDEMAGLHERLSELPVRAVVGPQNYAWVVVAAPLAVVAGLLFVRFLRALPRPVAALTLLAGALYVGGAAGMEVAGGVLLDAGADQEGLLLDSVQHVEEACEMAGAALFLHVVARVQQGVHPLRPAPADVPADVPAVRAAGVLGASVR